MLKIENFEVMGWEHAIRGMRNPMNSWDKSDSGDGCKRKYHFNGDIPGPHLCKDCSTTYDSHCPCTGREKGFIVGENDLGLMKRLRNGGPVHAKYRRMITVYLDITAPLYWWKEFDTYKVGTVANSCSTMHKIHSKEFTLDDFSHEQLIDFEDPLMDYLHNDSSDHAAMSPLDDLEYDIYKLNKYRDLYLKTKDKKWWWQMIQRLPSSYNQKRTVMLNYEVLANIYKWRKDHKLDEWHTFCHWIEELPYSELITGYEEEN